MMLLVRMNQTLADLLASSRYVVEGDSMLPTLVSGQHVLAVPATAPRRRPRRGDIVVFHHPVLRGHMYIKRVIGLPDEDIQMKAGRAYIAGVLLAEPYLSAPTSHSDSHSEEHSQEWWTGPDEYFVLGDNRDASRDDSRAFGPISGGLVIGRVWFRYWPIRTWGPVPGKMDSLGLG